MRPEQATMAREAFNRTVNHVCIEYGMEYVSETDPDDFCSDDCREDYYEEF